MSADDPTETDESLAARRFAATLGMVEGSSYTTDNGTPVAWAFDVRYPAFGSHRLIVARSMRSAHIYMLVREELASSGRLMALAVAGVNPEFLEPHHALSPVADTFGGLSRTDYCVDFYLCEARFGAPVSTPGLVAVGLRPEEARLRPNKTLALLRARTPEGLTTLDPRRHEPWYLAYASVLRAARRKLRLIKIRSPERLVANASELLEDRLAKLNAAGWDPKLTPLPPDVRATLDGRP